MTRKGVWHSDNSDGEFDPGSGSTLAACLMHASHTGGLRVAAWRTAEEHVRTCRPVGNTGWKHPLIPQMSVLRCAD